MRKAGSAPSKFQCPSLKTRMSDHAPTTYRRPESLAAASRQYAPGVAIIANGDLHHLDNARRVLEHSADLLAIGKSALVNSNLPQKLATGQPLKEFSPEILSPIANVKEAELAADYLGQ